MTLLPAAYTIREFGDWFPFPYYSIGDRIHAIKFEDGRIIDVKYGLRANSITKDFDYDEIPD